MRCLSSRFRAKQPRWVSPPASVVYRSPPLHSCLLTRDVLSFLIQVLESFGAARTRVLLPQEQDARTVPSAYNAHFSQHLSESRPLCFASRFGISLVYIVTSDVKLRCADGSTESTGSWSDVSTAAAALKAKIMTFAKNQASPTDPLRCYIYIYIYIYMEKI